MNQHHQNHRGIHAVGHGGARRPVHPDDRMPSDAVAQVDAAPAIIMDTSAFRRLVRDLVAAAGAREGFAGPVTRPGAHRSEEVRCEALRIVDQSRGPISAADVRLVLKAGWTAEREHTLGPVPSVSIISRWCRRASDQRDAPRAFDPRFLLPADPTSKDAVERFLLAGRRTLATVMDDRGAVPRAMVRGGPAVGEIVPVDGMPRRRGTAPVSGGLAHSVATSTARRRRSGDLPPIPRS